MRRIAGVFRHPRSTMAALVAAPSWFPTWVFILALWLVPAGWFLSTPTGRLVLVDERVRLVEAFGGRLDAAQYDALVQSTPWDAYLTSGGRLLLTPPVTLLVAAGLLMVARVDGSRISFVTALAITVHATVVLALQQIIATPVHYVSESLTSPTNLALAFCARRRHVAGAVVRHDRCVRPVVDVAAERWAAAATARPARRYCGGWWPSIWVWQRASPRCSR